MESVDVKMVECVCSMKFENLQELSRHIGDLISAKDYRKHLWKPNYQCFEQGCRFVAVSALKLMHHYREWHQINLTCFGSTNEKIDNIEKRRRLKKYFIDLQKLFPNKTLMEIGHDLCDFGEPRS